ncbi:replication-relaxation family protein [Streptomyces sp. SAS_275]|uniref:replication-relaxation family protein n=1 Tax=Streptomyces sp. SAS_275 TaxID=3412746 RepID=UPI00403D42A0
MNRPEQKRPALRTSSEPLRHQALAALAQHRIATSGHLHQMLCPLSTRQVMSRVLSKLSTDAFIDRTTPPEAGRSRTKAWYLTPHGARLTRDLPVLRGRQTCPITSDTAASLKTSHTRAVVRAHLAIAADARQRGHKHGPRQAADSPSRCRCRRPCRVAAPSTSGVCTSPSPREPWCRALLKTRPSAAHNDVSECNFGPCQASCTPTCKEILHVLLCTHSYA